MRKMRPALKEVTRRGACCGTREMMKEGRVQHATEEVPRAHRSLDRPGRIGRISPGRAEELLQAKVKVS